jgi:hypothetical protein
MDFGHEIIFKRWLGLGIEPTIYEFIFSPQGSRVARCMYVNVIPKIPIWINFGVPWNEIVGKFYGRLECFTAIFVYFVAIWHICHVFLLKNLHNN